MDDISLRPRISFVHAYLSFLWINLNEHTKDSNNILENTIYIYIYIYLKIQTYVNIRPQAWHMLVS